MRFYCDKIKTLSEICMFIAVICVLLTFYIVGLMLYSMATITFESHDWEYYLNAIIGIDIISVLMHGLLFAGAKFEHKYLIFSWLMVTTVIFPLCIFYMVVCFYEAFYLSLIDTLFITICRVYMWTKVRDYYRELINRNNSDTNITQDYQMLSNPGAIVF